MILAKASKSEGHPPKITGQSHLVLNASGMQTEELTSSNAAAAAILKFREDMSPLYDSPVMRALVRTCETQIKFPSLPEGLQPFISHLSRVI